MPMKDPNTGAVLDCKFSDTRILQAAEILCQRDQKARNVPAHEMLSGDIKHCTGCDLIAAFEDGDPELVVWFIETNEETK